MLMVFVLIAAVAFGGIAGAAWQVGQRHTAAMKSGAFETQADRVRRTLRDARPIANDNRPPRNVRFAR